MSYTQSPKRKTLDPATYAFAQRVFAMARQDDAAGLGPLLDQGIPANIRNLHGDTLLMLAVAHGHTRTARLLLEHGADPELRNEDGETPLTEAAYRGDVELIELLLEYDADLDGVRRDGRTPLMLAAMFDRAPVVELLLRRGANVRARDAGGLNALDLAQAMGAEHTPSLLYRALRPPR